MTQLTYKISKTHNYGIELNPNFTTKRFAVRILSMDFSKFQNLRTIKLSNSEFERFYYFSGDQWMDIFFNPELCSKYLIFIDNVKRCKTK
jgi:hypothetical protein